MNHHTVEDLQESIENFDAETFLECLSDLNFRVRESSVADDKGNTLRFENGYTVHQLFMEEVKKIADENRSLNDYIPDELGVSSLVPSAQNNPLSVVNDFVDTVNCTLDKNFFRLRKNLKTTHTHRY